MTSAPAAPTASSPTSGRTAGRAGHATSRRTAGPSLPRHAQALESNDPLFTPNDGSDCPPTSPSQGPNSALSSEVLNYGLIRIELGIPATANFTLASATNPKGCAVPPGSSGVGGQLFLFRRPLPSTNLIFDSAIMWDGRETLERLTTQANFQSLVPFLFDLADQANSATTGHAQGASIVGTPAQADIVAFETNLYTAQSLLSQLRQGLFALLTADGAHGGPDYLEDTVAPAFFIGINDPLKPGVHQRGLRPLRRLGADQPELQLPPPEQQAIGRGEAIFNNTTFVIHDVPGLNSAPCDPLYNPADPLAGQDINGGCAVCHNNPNVGNHSTSLPINIGVTMAQPMNNDGSPNNVLDIANCPSTHSRTPRPVHRGGHRPREGHAQRQVDGHREDEGADVARARGARALLPQRLGEGPHDRGELLQPAIRHRSHRAAGERPRRIPERALRASCPVAVRHWTS